MYSGKLHLLQYRISHGHALLLNEYLKTHLCEPVLTNLVLHKNNLDDKGVELILEGIGRQCPELQKKQNPAKTPASCKQIVISQNQIGLSAIGHLESIL